MRAPHRFTLMELVMVITIIIISGAMVTGALSKLPRAAALGENVGRVRAVYALAREQAVTYARTMEVTFNAETGVLSIATPTELEESDYGTTHAEGRVKGGEAKYDRNALPMERRRSSFAVEHPAKLEFEIDRTLEEQLSPYGFVPFETVSHGEEPVAAPVVARFYPDGGGEGLSWRLSRGRLARYGRISGLDGTLEMSEAPFEEWIEEETP